MLKSQSSRSARSIVALAAIVFSMTAVAGPAAEVEESRKDATISWSTAFQWDHAVISLSGPAGATTSWTVPAGQPLVIDTAALHLWAKALSKPVDGGYNYEVRFAPKLDEATRAEFDRLRAAGGGGETGDPVANKLPMVAGHFLLAGGVIVGGAEEGHTKLVHDEDTYIIGNLCVGNDCVDGDNLAFKNILLKANNLRVHFDDTSGVLPGFPANDWEITANDTEDGGASYLAFTDVTADQKPFVVEAGAPENTLYVEELGRIGLGTSTPAVEFHIKDNDSPTVRLEQDSSSGWDPQIWDLVGNETNFYLRDVTNGSKLPFRVQPGSPTHTLSIRSSGNVGLGTWTPTAALEIERTGSAPAILLQRTDAAINSDWFLTGAADGSFTLATSDEVVLILDSLGNLTTSGTVNGISDVAAKKDFVPVDGAKMLEAVIRLGITEWALVNDTNGARHIGPTAQDFRAAFGLGSDERHISLSDVSGVALAAIQGLVIELEARDREIDDLNQRLAHIEELMGGHQ